MTSTTPSTPIDGRHASARRGIVLRGSEPTPDRLPTSHLSTCPPPEHGAL